jgi:hypothetical protein
MPTTPTDILTRLRAANPAPVSPDRAQEPTARATLERILNDPGPDPASRPTQPTRRWLSAAPVLAAALIALAVVGAALVLVGRGRGPASASHPPRGGIEALIAHTPKRQLQRELGYVFAATRSVASSKACHWQQPSRTTYIQGSPGSGLLSILGVLRRPATPADRFAPGPAQPIRDVYRAYIRRAFSADAASYYLVPARGDSYADIPSDRCLGLEATALNRYLPGIPRALRQPTREIGAAYIAYLRSLASEATQSTICLVAAGNGGGASCGFAAKGIEEGFAVDNSLGTPLGIFSGVVPDGVATVTLDLPAFGRQRAHAVSTRVKGNVYAVHVSGLSRSQVSPTVIWRSPEGRVLKRMSTSPAATRAYVCKQSQVACLLASALAGVSSSSSGAQRAS